MNRIGNNVRKYLPSLALGVCITVLATLFTYLLFGRGLTSRVAGDHIITVGADAGEETQPPPPGRV
ncbi:MAG: hypothetical protein LIP77_00910, partial [Planctomycetes bacterium]|nr:hypothetical protein [Planctomycetota bacterium]